MDDNEEGSAVVEFIFLSLMLLVPIVYLILTLAQVQAAAFAAEAAARDVGRAAVVGGVDALHDGESLSAAERAARARAAAALETTLGDFRVDPESADVELSCSADPCLTPGSEVRVVVTIEVRLPGIAALVPRAVVTVDAAGSSPVDGYLP